MDKFVVIGGKSLHGSLQVSGAKNVALKALVAAVLTTEPVTIHNVPLIADVFVMIDILHSLGVQTSLDGHSITIQADTVTSDTIPLDMAAKARTSVMFIAPLLIRNKKAIVPNPGGCRLGARPIDRIIDGIKDMHADVSYHRDDGYFYAKTDGLEAISYTFEKNTHMGTETMILAAVLAKGTTVLDNAAEEPEIDELITLLNEMGANIKRSGKRRITIQGVANLHGASYTIKPDRNEIVTFAIAAIISHGDVCIEKAATVDLDAFLKTLDAVGAGYEKKGEDIRFFSMGALQATDITTGIYPGFMTDWQAPFAVLLTQATGISTIHETVFENKFGYVADLKRMGAKITLYNPSVPNPEIIYNFNMDDDDPSYYHGVKIDGPTKLHNAVVKTVDIRAGAAIVLAALIAQGETTIHGAARIDRGYEEFEKRLQYLGANITRVADTL